MDCTYSGETTYLTAAETTKLIRRELKEQFPATSFSVRVCSGGSSATVRWIDGPLQDDVERAVWPYRGATFDGMIDLETSVFHRSEDGGRVSYGTKYIFCQREYSRTFVELVLDSAGLDRAEREKVRLGEGYHPGTVYVSCEDYSLLVYILRKLQEKEG